jgi:dienelactone hydrolase
MRPTPSEAVAGVVYLHGSGSIGSRQLRYAQRFAEHGMLSLAPVYTDAAPDDGVRSRPIMQAWRDCAADAVDWLVSQGAPHDRMVLAGYSLGSHIAVDSALQGGRCRAAIGIAAGWDVYPPRPPRRRIPTLIIRADSDHHVRPGSTDRLITFLRDANVPVTEARVRDGEHIMTDDQWAIVHGYSMDFLTDVLGLSGRE